MAAARAEMESFGKSAEGSAGQVAKTEKSAASAASGFAGTGKAAKTAEKDVAKLAETTGGKFVKSAGEAEKRMLSMKSAGSGLLGTLNSLSGLSLTGGTALAAGFAAAGVMAIHMADQFDASMTKIQALVGGTKSQIEDMANSVLDMAGKVGKSPNELAQGLYFVESAGFKGAQGLRVLKIAAEDSASGMGDTATVADALTSALNAYGVGAQEATHYSDVMIAAVRAGKMPADALAGAVGQILPIAAQLGVNFEQVAGALAASSRQGLSVNRTATGLRFLLTGFMAPSTQAAKGIDKVFGSAQNLQHALADPSVGLVGVLKKLKDDLPQAEFAKTVGGARGLATAMALVGKNSKATDEVMKQVRNSAGSTAQAFQTTQGSMSQQLKELASTFESLMIRLGRALEPIAEALVSALKTVLPILGGVVSLFAQLLDTIKPLLPVIISIGLAWLAWKGMGTVLGMLTTKTQALTTATEEQGAAQEAASGGSLLSKVGALGKGVMFLAGAWLAVKGNALAAHAAASGNTAGAAAGVGMGMAGGAAAGFAVGGPIGAGIGAVIGGVTSSMAANKASADLVANALTKIATSAKDAFDKGKISADEFQSKLAEVSKYADFSAPLDKTTAALLKDNGAAYVNESITSKVVEERVQNTKEVLKEQAAIEKQRLTQLKANAAQIQNEVLARRRRNWMQNDRQILVQFTKATGQSYSDFMTNAVQAAKKGQGAWDTFVNDTKASYRDWHDSIQSNFFDVGTFLSGLSKKQQGSMDDMNKALEGQITKLNSYSQNWKTVSERAGGKADDLLAAIQSMGLDGATTLQTLAGASDKQFATFMGNVDKAKGKSSDLATLIQDDLVGSIHDLITAIQGIPGFHSTTLDINTDPAVRQMVNFNAQMAKAGIPIHMDLAGALHGRRTGGPVPGGWGGGDRTLIAAEPGEYVLRKEAVRAMGRPTVESLNRMGTHLARYQLGGLVPDTAAFGQMASNIGTSQLTLELKLPTVAQMRALSGGGAGVQGFLDAAKSLLGRPYVFGADGPDAFDCSGFVYAALNKAGVHVPRLSARGYQSYFKDHVPGSQMMPGDLPIYWYSNSRGIPPGQASHIEIYMGGGRAAGYDHPGELGRIEGVDYSALIEGLRVDQLQGGGGPGGPGGGGPGPVPTGSVQQIVNSVAGRWNWGSGREWMSIVDIINAESGWRPTAQNPTSSAYGLFQFLDATWQIPGITYPKTSDPYRQSVDGMEYIKMRYGDPIHAWAYHQLHHSYGAGGILPEDIVGVGRSSGDRYSLHAGETVVSRGGGPTKMAGTFRLARGDGGMTMVLDGEADWIDKSRGW